VVWCGVVCLGYWWSFCVFRCQCMTPSDVQFRNQRSRPTTVNSLTGASISLTMQIHAVVCPVPLTEWLILRLCNGGSHLQQPFWYFLLRMSKVSKRDRSRKQYKYDICFNVLTEHRKKAELQYRNRLTVIIFSGNY
jgi:hypothetical protein